VFDPPDCQLLVVGEDYNDEVAEETEVEEVEHGEGQNKSNSDVIGEQNREEYKLPDESDDGEDNPNYQGKPDLLDTAQDEENINQSIPGKKAE